MAIDAETTRRMTNWARWKVGGASIELAMSSAYDLEARGRREAVSVPLMNGEALDVDRAVHDLPGELVLVVEQHWLKRGSVGRKAKRCGCAISTFYRRLEDAHYRVQVYLLELRRRRPDAALTYPGTLSSAQLERLGAPACTSCGERHWLRERCPALDAPVVKPA